MHLNTASLLGVTLNTNLNRLIKTRNMKLPLEQHMVLSSIIIQVKLLYYLISLLGGKRFRNINNSTYTMTIFYFYVSTIDRGRQNLIKILFYSF